MMHGTGTLCVYVFIASYLLASASAGQPGPIKFAEWLQEQAHPTVVKASTAGGYREPESISVCLKVAGLKNCRCEECPANTKEPYHHRHYGERAYDSLMVMGDMEIGTAETTENYFETSVPVGTTDNLSKVGTFTTVMTLTSGGQCGHPFCDSMVLRHTGTIYGVEKAASRTNPVPPQSDSDCKDRFDRRAKASEPGTNGSDKDMTASTGTVAAASVAAAGAAYTTYGSRDDSATYYSARAVVYSGPVFISSPKHSSKFLTGHMDFVRWNECAIPPGRPACEVQVPPVESGLTAAEVAGLPMVEPWTYQLKIYKSEGEY